eukprot:scaffold971_cov107-Isochrysis_galbana.AAC.6
MKEADSGFRSTQTCSKPAADRRDARSLGSGAPATQQARAWAYEERVGRLDSGGLPHPDSLKGGGSVAARARAQIKGVFEAHPKELEVLRLRRCLETKKVSDAQTKGLSQAQTTELHDDRRAWRGHTCAVRRLSGSSLVLTTSAMATRPPGLSTRKASRATLACHTGSGAGGGGENRMKTNAPEALVGSDASLIRSGGDEARHGAATRARCRSGLLGPGPSSAALSHLVGRQIDDTIGDDHVAPPVGQRQRLERPFQELDVGRPGLAGGLARLGYHLLRHVHAAHPAGRPDSRCGEQAVQPRPRPKIDDRLAWLQLGEPDWVAAAKAEVGAGGLTNRTLGRTVAERALLCARRHHAARSAALGGGGVGIAHNVSGHVVVGWCSKAEAPHERRVALRGSDAEGQHCGQPAGRGQDGGALSAHDGRAGSPKIEAMGSVP